MATQTTKQPDAHSSVVGGSSAEKRIMCPASYQLEQKLPASAKSTSSEYADEGTALHEAMSDILLNMIDDLDDILGVTYGVSESSPAGYVMTQELIDSALTPCFDFFTALDDEAQSEGGLDFYVEQKVQMPGIPEAFGTADLIGRTNARSIIVDWKFGVGVPVAASYGGRPNYQLMYYARAAMHSLPQMFEDRPDWPVDLYIVQPRGRDVDPSQCYTHYQTTVKELEEFRMLLVRRVIEAKDDPKPTLQKGPWCKFAVCKTICPAFTGPAVGMTMLSDKLQAKRTGQLIHNVDVKWPQLYGELLDMAEAAEAVIGEIRTQAHSFLEQGNTICDDAGEPTWKLVQKRATEKYTDEQGAVRMALAHGVDVLTKPTTKSPAQLRTALAETLGDGSKKAREEAAKTMIGKFTANVSSGTTLAPASDKRREFIATASRVAALSTKLAALTKQ